MGREPDSAHPGVQPPEADAVACDFGLPRSRRMLPALYRDTFARERSVPGRFLVLWLRVAPDADRRMGVVTSRRTLPSAVSRNRARRLLREAFRLNRTHLQPDVDVLLLARGRIEHVKRQDVEADLRTTCRRAGIWRESPC
ncbi:MAG: ribonuclease P protein component [bacterium]